MSMINVTHKGKTYRIEFEHAERDFVVPKTKKSTAITEKRWMTTCSIWLQPKRGNVKCVAAGKAVCRPPGKFSRPEGRMRALARAVVALTGPRKKMMQKWNGKWKAFFRGSCYENERLIRNGYAKMKPISGVRELRLAIWNAYFARCPQRFSTGWMTVRGCAVIERVVPSLTDEQVTGIVNAAAKKTRVKRVLETAGAPATEK